MDIDSFIAALAAEYAALSAEDRACTAANDNDPDVVEAAALLIPAAPSPGCA